MSAPDKTRRDFLKAVGVGAAAMVSSIDNTTGKTGAKKQLLTVDPRPRFDLSPYLYMQFMEPLGATDGSVAAAWDFVRDCWREDVTEVTKELAPTVIRWGGAFIAYYRWKEAVGPRDQRKPMINIAWGGMESNQVGTGEFVDFCRQAGAEPLMCVNFESEGRNYSLPASKGGVRSAGPEEAAEWVDYCNNPSNATRRRHGVKEPYKINLWQIGNETSYGRNRYDCETASRRTIAFAKAMREADPNIKLIGWGDRGWAPKMIENAGEHLQYIAFHHMFNPDSEKLTLRDNEFRRDPDRTWDILMNAYKPHETKIKGLYEQVKRYNMPLAMTECHFSLPGRNRCEVLSTWAAGVSYARLLNVHERYGDILKIATAADFCGTRWQVNAIMIPVPLRRGKAFMMPVAHVMSLYRKHTGEKYVKVIKVPDGLDITASRTGNRIFLHVVNTKRMQSVGTELVIDRMTIKSGLVFEIATDPEFEVIKSHPNVIAAKEKEFPKDGLWTFPAASVSAIELEVENQAG